MKVKLIKDVYEKDRFGNEVLKVSKHRGVSTPFVEGRVVEMSDASGEKYIRTGQAVRVIEEQTDESERPSEKTVSGQRTSDPK